MIIYHHGAGEKPEELKTFVALVSEDWWSIVLNTLMEKNCTTWFSCEFVSAVDNPDEKAAEPTTYNLERKREEEKMIANIKALSLADDGGKFVGQACSLLVNAYVAYHFLLAH